MSEFKILKGTDELPVLINTQNITYVQRGNKTTGQIFFTGDADNFVNVLGTIEEVIFTLTGKRI